MLFRFLLVILFSSVSFASAQQYTMASDLWCPYICADQQAPGYVVEIVDTVLHRLGHTSDVNLLPLSRALAEASNGRVDLVLAVTPEHLQDYDLKNSPIAIGQFTQDFYARSTANWHFTDLDDLKQHLAEGERLGLISGYSYGPEIDSLVKQYPQRVIFARGDEPLLQLIRMLVNERVDFILDSVATVQYSLGNGEATGVRYVGSIGDSAPLYIGFAPTLSDDLIRAFDAELSQLIKEGGVSDILQRYHVTAW